MGVVGIALRGFGKALKKFSKNKQRVKDVRKGILAGAGTTLAGNVLGFAIASKLKKNKSKPQKKFGPPGGKKYPKYGVK